MARGLRRRPVPPALRLAFGGRVRTLEDVILSLLPPPAGSPEGCRCRGRRCLRCGRAPHLLRPGDPPEYRRLLTRAFCVPTEVAPEPPVVFSGGEGRSQRQVVKYTIELIMDNLQKPTNVLCNSYDRESRFSPNGEFLCNSAWDLLLSRIGNPLMGYLLQYSSIFLPLRKNNHYQATGPPLDASPQRRRSSTSKDQHVFHSKTLFNVHSSGHNNLKRRHDDFEERGDKPKKNIRNCQRMGRETDEQSNVEDGVNNSYSGNRNSYGAPQCQFKPDMYLYSVEPTGQSMLQEESLFTPVSYTSQYGKAVKADGLFPPPSKEIHLGRMMSTCSPSKFSSLDPVIADDGGKSFSCGIPSKPRKHGRLFSWQRRGKSKKNYPRETDWKCTKVKLEHNLGMNNSPQPLIPDRLITCSIATEVQQKKDQELHTVPVTAENVGAIDNEIHCSVLAKELDHEQNYLPFMENRRCPHKALSNKEGETESDIYVERLGNQSTCSQIPQIASMCFYCLTLQTSRQVAMGAQIRRRVIFYNRFSSFSVFPKNHILNRLKPNDLGAISLMKHIFGFPDGQISFQPCIHSSGFCDIKSDCLYHSVLGLLKSLIRNAQRCQHKKLLLKHCLVTTFKRCDKNDNRLVSQVEGRLLSGCSSNDAEMSKDGGPQFELIESYCTHQQVVSFIWAVARSIVPPSLLGNFSAWRSLQKNISKFVRLRRFENFHLKQCIHGLKTSSYPFLLKIRLSDCFCNSRIKHEFRNGDDTVSRMLNGNKLVLLNNVFHSWIFWFFSHMVAPIIGTNFYATEKESTRHDIFYYPKSVWRNLVERATMDLKKNLRIIDQTSFRHILSERQFGFSKVRFVPKEKSVRLIANLKAPSVVPDLDSGFSSRSYFNTNVRKAKIYQKPMSTDKKRKLVRLKSVNSALYELYAVLTGIKVEHPEMLGSSVFDYSDVYQNLHRYLSKIKNRSMETHNLYIVVADVRKAFDSVDHDMLIGIMTDAIQNDNYVVRRYARIGCGKKSIKSLVNLVFHNCSCNYVSKFEASTRSSSTCSIFIDQGHHERIKKEKLLFLLSEHLRHNILQIGQKFYLQRLGISQGSLLSSLLCSFYYGHLERNVILPHLEKTPSDDAFHDKSLVKGGVACLEHSRTSGLHEGKNDLAADFCSNGCTDENSSSRRNLLLRLIDDFLFISTSKKQASSFLDRMSRGFRDYNCFMNRKKFGLNFDVEQHRHIINRLYEGADGVSFLPWSGLLLNCNTLEIQADYTRYSNINISSTVTVRAHSRPAQHLKAKLCDYMLPKCHPIFYDSNINSPMTVRLNAYQAFLLCAMKFHCYVCSMADILKLNPNYVMKIIQRSFSYMYRLLKKRMHDMEVDFNIRPAFELAKRETIWLGISAYIRVLKKKQSRHKELLSLLRAQIETYGRIEDASPYLRHAVHDSHSSVFWTFKY